MHNIIIIGTVRSGTSMTAALFRDTQASYGDNIMSASISNPYGYYECFKINQLNDRIIKRILRERLPLPNRLSKIAKPFRPPIHTDGRASMLAIPDRIPNIELPEADKEEIIHFVSNPLFCYKDPRFSITLPFWRKHLSENTRYIVVFRSPKRTVDSMIRNSQNLYTPPLPVNEQWGFKLWRSYYDRILNDFADSQNWLFVHDEVLFNRRAIPAIEKFVETKVNTDQINPDIRRSKPKSIKYSGRRYRECVPLYQALIKRSIEDIDRLLA